jgi:hypothetical protein
MVVAASPPDSGGCAVTATHFDDAAVSDADVGREAIGARSVDDGPAGDLHVEHGVPLNWGSGH